MRVISGKARSLKLKSVDGMNTRPTTDRIKETLFNIIGYRVLESNFLDLFSGSGAIGIEALSRGAHKAWFVENNRAALNCIRDNLKFTKLESDAEIFSVSAIDALAKLENSEITFDIVFMDPPYNKSFEKGILIFLSKSVLINKSSTIIVEASAETDFDYVMELGFIITKEKKYKTNKHVFLELNGD